MPPIRLLRTDSMNWIVTASHAAVLLALCCAPANAAPRQPTGYFVIQKVGGQNVSDANSRPPSGTEL